MVKVTKVDVNNTDGVLSLTWSDSRVTKYSIQELRKNCPCANCAQERKKSSEVNKGGLLELRVIDERKPEVRQASIVDFNPIGRYALGFTFNDGHGTGIYTYEILREMAGVEGY